MTAFSTLKAEVLSLPEDQRFRLLAEIEESLPPPPHFDEDGGEAEAMRRMAEGDRDPAVWLTGEQFDEAVKAARKR